MSTSSCLILFLSFVKKPGKKTQQPATATAMVVLGCTVLCCTVRRPVRRSAGTRCCNGKKPMTSSPHKIARNLHVKTRGRQKIQHNDQPQTQKPTAKNEERRKIDWQRGQANSAAAEAAGGSSSSLAALLLALLALATTGQSSHTSPLQLISADPFLLFVILIAGFLELLKFRPIG